MLVECQLTDSIATVTINNPERANVITQQVAGELSDAWRRCQDDHRVKAVVLTAAGDRHFSGGHNLVPRSGVTQEELQYLSLERTFRPLSGTVNGFPTGADPTMADHFPRISKPVVAAVNGLAVGAGLYLLLASTDIRIAARGNAYFKYGLVSRGWIGAGPSATLLLKQLRHVDAMRMLLEDPTIDADEAVRIGLVNEAVEPQELMPTARAVARSLAEKPVHAVRFIKEFAHRFADLPVEQAWHVQSLMNDLLVHSTADGTEGRTSFLDRREPEWTGDYQGTEIRTGDQSDEQRERLEKLRREIDW